MNYGTIWVILQEFKYKMKNILFLLLGFCLLNFSSQAQKKKPVNNAKPVTTNSVSNAYRIAYVYEDVVLDKYVAVKKLQAQIAEKQDKSQQQYNQLAIMYQTQYLEYQNGMKNIDSMTTEKLNAKLKSVQTAKQVAEDFQRNTEKEIQEMTGNGIQVIKIEMDRVIKEVAAEKKFALVLTRNKKSSLITPGHVVLYSNDAGKNDLSEAVIAKLNTGK